MPGSCEADVNGTVTSLLLQALSGAQAFITDLVSIEAESDTGVLWHCGLAPASMADPEGPILGTIHSNRKLPLLFEFPLKPGASRLRACIAPRWTMARAGYQFRHRRRRDGTRAKSFTGTSPASSASTGRRRRSSTPSCAPGWNTTSASPTATTRRNCAALHGWRGWLCWS
ncbi:MAG: hypothetical protein H6639_03770 [Caldilineaceae bacterium]|nr:hypothetical protein [Caldilineaceae bacterium]